MIDSPLFLEPVFEPVVEKPVMPYFNTHTPHGRDQARAWKRQQRKAALAAKEAAKSGTLDA